MRRSLHPFRRLTTGQTRPDAAADDTRYVWDQVAGLRTETAAERQQRELSDSIAAGLARGVGGDTVDRLERELTTEREGIAARLRRLDVIGAFQEAPLGVLMIVGGALAAYGHSDEHWLNRIAQWAGYGTMIAGGMVAIRRLTLGVNLWTGLP